MTQLQTAGAKPAEAWGADRLYWSSAGPESDFHVLLQSPFYTVCGLLGSPQSPYALLHRIYTACYYLLIQISANKMKLFATKSKKYKGSLKSGAITSLPQGIQI